MLHALAAVVAVVVVASVAASDSSAVPIGTNLGPETTLITGQSVQDTVDGTVVRNYIVRQPVSNFTEVAIAVEVVGASSDVHVYVGIGGNAMVDPSRGSTYQYFAYAFGDGATIVVRNTDNAFTTGYVPLFRCRAGCKFLGPVVAPCCHCNCWCIVSGEMCTCKRACVPWRGPDGRGLVWG